MVDIWANNQYNNRYWTICFPDTNSLGEEYDKWETLSDRDIINEYWEWWSGKMLEKGPNDSCTFENCITDWVIVHWAVRNYWREMKEIIS